MDKLQKPLWFICQMGMWAGLFSSMAATVVYFTQNSMLYHPGVPKPQNRYPVNNPTGYRNPNERGMDYEDIFFETRDKVKINAWFVKSHPDARTVIFFHGNAGNIGTRLPNIEVMVKVMKCNVLIVAYRGYSNSEGTPSEEGLKLDAEASLEWAQSRKDIK